MEIRESDLLFSFREDIMAVSSIKKHSYVIQEFSILKICKKP